MLVHTKKAHLASFSLILALYVSFVPVLTSLKAADKLESPRYQIELNDMSVGQKLLPQDSPEEPATSVLTGTEKAVFSQKGAVVKQISSEKGIKVDISDSSLTYDISSTLAQTQELSLILSTDANIRYSALVAQSHGLIHSSGFTIPNTGCNKDTHCNSTFSAPWTEQTPGLGYSLDTTYFRPFADLSQAEKPKMILSNVHMEEAKEVTMTIKLVKPKNMPEGTYQNNIYIITNPTY